MKILRNKLFLGVLCILIGLLVGFVAIPAFQQHEQSETVQAVRLKVPVQAGGQITADMLEVIGIPPKLVPGSVPDTASAVGRYAIADLFAGDYLTAAKTAGALPDGVSFSAGMSEGKRAVSITLPSLAAGISGHLLPGDLVTVMAVPKSATTRSLGIDPDTANEAEPAVTPIIYPELKYVEVCMTTTADGSDAQVVAHPEDEEKNQLPATVSFYVTQAQALRLAELEQQGTIHLAFVARGKDRAQYVTDTVLVGTEVK